MRIPSAWRANLAAAGIIVGVFGIAIAAAYAAKPPKPSVGTTYRSISIRVEESSLHQLCTRVCQTGTTSVLNLGPGQPRTSPGNGPAVLYARQRALEQRQEIRP